MADDVNVKQLYLLLLSLKEEIKQLSVHMKAMRKEMKGETDNGRK